MIATISGESLFPALVVGRDALSEEETAVLQSYLLELCVRRGFPLSPAICWNALYWKFDLERGQYTDAPLERFTPVRHGERIDALPIGAFVSVPAGGSANEFWGEVVYKEGRRVGMDDGWIDPAFSGAPAKLEEVDGLTVAVLHEALIIDFEAVVEPTGQSLERQRLRESVIDERHHLVVDAQYGAGDAEIDDATYFARWMLEHFRADLVQGRFGAGLSVETLGDDELLFSALVSSLTTLREIMANTPRCAMWRDYLFDLETYEQRLDAESADNPLGRNDLQRLPRSLTRLQNHATTSYSSLGARLIEFSSGDASLNGPGWSTAICHASHFLIEWLEESSPDGWCDTPPGLVHLRLDDAWQSGGIWRAELLATGRSAYCAIPPEVALGLGYAEASGALQVSDIDEGEPELIVEANQLSTRSVLSMLDIAQDRLRVPRAMLEEIGAVLLEAGQQSAVVRLEVDGEELDRARRVHVTTLHMVGDEVSSLHGIQWPWPFAAGARANVVWTRGGVAVDVVLRRRDEPFVIGEFFYEYECDERMFARGVGVPAPPSARGRTLRDLVLDVFHRRTELLDDGRRRATLQRVVHGVYGPTAPPAAVESIRRTLEELCTGGTLVFEGDNYVWTPSIGCSTRVGDRGLFDEYFADGMRRFVSLHEVGLFLRHLAVSPAASIVRQEEYRREWERAGRPAWLPAELPKGMTFVHAHKRGSRRLTDDPDESI
jgi:hypothetical protein